jgi:hypothetical protein
VPGTAAQVKVTDVALDGSAEPFGASPVGPAGSAKAVDAPVNTAIAATQRQILASIDFAPQPASQFAHPKDMRLIVRDIASTMRALFTNVLKLFPQQKLDEARTRSKLQKTTGPKPPQAR